MSNYFASEIIKRGDVVYAPISHTFPIAEENNLPKDWKFWKKFDGEFLKISKKLIIIMLDGWKQSIGVQAEIQIAKKLKIPIEYIDPIEYFRKHGKPK